MNIRDTDASPEQLFLTESHHEELAYINSDKSCSMASGILCTIVKTSMVELHELPAASSRIHSKPNIIYRCSSRCQVPTRCVLT